MTDYEIYIFLLCSIVFLMLTTLSVVCLTIITKLTLRLIRLGADDDKILEEYRKNQFKKPNKFFKFVDYAFTGVVCLAFALSFIGSLFIGCTENELLGDAPALLVVKTGSMAEKNEKNKYLEENNLDNQIQVFDLIHTEKLPEEMELELYDIVVYETDGMMIIHRIVGIEEPNSEHPDCRYFLLQGDAVEAPDRFPVRYEQMHAIYRGSRVPFIGSFILFMQSPAGWLCMLLIVVSMIASPAITRCIQNEKDKRVALHYPNGIDC